MSDVVKMANEEADQVEAEEEDAGEAGELDDPVEPEPEPEDEPVVDEAAIRKANRAIEDQRARLAKILGDAAVAHDCILCGALGYTPEPPTVGMTFEVVDTGDGIALDFRAPRDVSRYKMALDKQMCDECDGEGLTQTGAKREGKELDQCGGCSGNGWKLKAREQPQTFYVPPLTTTTGNGAPATPAPLPPDAWDRPPGHEHYGIPPAAIGSVGV